MKRTQNPEIRFWRKVDRKGPEDCWPWRGGSTPKGYGRFRRGRKLDGMIGAHQFSYELAHGPVPVDQQVCHRCDNPSCVNPAHLFLGTQSDNILDCLSKGRGRGQFALGNDSRRKTGSDSHFAKLEESDIPTIRADTRKHREIAAAYGVHRSLIGLIKRRLIWQHVP